MMTLSRVRLVNWHFFSDVTLQMGPLSLLAGDNGSGKSTIIDAIQYGLVAKVQRIRFNAAATEQRTARTLESYTRAKVGADGLDYLRGDCLSHVILEFTAEGRRSCAGIMIESFREGDCREHPWLLYDAGLDEIAVYDEEHFVPPRRFRDEVKARGGRICPTKGDYNNRLTHLLGVHRRGSDFNPYFAALVRSVSFTPFTSVHDFVCDYILEERTVDVGAMKENLLNYRAAEREAAAMEERIVLLQQVQEKREALFQVVGQIRRQEYLRLRLLLEKEESATQETAAALESEKAALQGLSVSLEEHAEQKQRLEGQRDELQVSLASDETRQAYQRLRRDRDDLLQQQTLQKERADRAEKIRRRVAELIGREPADPAAETQTVTAEVSDASMEKARSDLRIGELKELLDESYRERKELQEGLLRYPAAVEKLRAALRSEGIEPEVLAELLEVAEEQHQELVESWLGNSRFALLVPRDGYARALEIYHEQESDVDGVFLPNLAAIHEKEIRPGSLAEMVAAANPDARRLVTQHLGDVIRTELSELLREDRSVTESALQYRDAAVVRAEKDARLRWYLGRRARERRLAAVEEAIEADEAALRAERAHEEELTAKLSRLREAERLLAELDQLGDAAARLATIEKELQSLEARIADMDTTGFESVQRQLDAVVTMLRELDSRVQEQLEERGRRTTTVTNLTQRLDEHRRERKRHAASLEGFLADHASRREEFESYYRDRMRGESQHPDYDEIIQRYESAFRGLRTREEKARHLLVQAKQRYNYEYNALLGVDDDESREYLELLDQYTRTELPEYRERIERARAEAERQFQEHFVARLNEYLMEAEESFKEINLILEQISFGKDSYRFTIQRRPDKRELMQAIATAAEVREVEGTLFAALKSEDERRSVESVFEKILTNELDSPEVREICDYRQYFVYDIKIRDAERVDQETGKALESFLSRVLREKSGGETQTPYYVAIAASFFRFYRDNPEAIRLVLFDEAFSKMDDARIGRMLDFFRTLNMQVLTAVPTEKIEAVAPHMDVTNLVIRRDNSAVVRRYEQLPEAEP